MFLFYYCFWCSCPLNGNAAALTIHPQPGKSAQRFSYRVFGLTGYEDRLQHFHCTVRVCDASDPKAFCNQGCDGNAMARRRRQVPDKVQVIQVPDGNTHFTFSAPPFFVSSIPERSSTSATPKRSSTSATPKAQTSDTMTKSAAPLKSQTSGMGIEKGYCPFNV